VINGIEFTHNFSRILEIYDTQGCHSTPVRIAPQVKG